MKVSVEEAREMIDDCHDEFEQVKLEVRDAEDWKVYFRVVTKHQESGRFYGLDFNKVTVEYYTMYSFNTQEEVELTEVQPVAKEVTKYEKVQQKKE